MPLVLAANVLFNPTSIIVLVSFTVTCSPPSLSSPSHLICSLSPSQNPFATVTRSRNQSIIFLGQKSPMTIELSRDSTTNPPTNLTRFLSPKKNTACDGSRNTKKQPHFVFVKKVQARISDSWAFRAQNVDRTSRHLPKRKHPDTLPCTCTGVLYVRTF